MSTRYFATCARGLEEILTRELRSLRADEVQPGRGGVAFAGERELLYRANLWLRTAVRVLEPILEVEVGTPDDLYEAVRTIDWTRFLTPAHTLAVDCNVRDSQITHSKYAALRTKDAICDQFIDRCGKRPSVDTEEPMLGLNLHIYRNQAVLSLDSSWDSLHKRGYRPVLTKAPLNEALAAGLIQLTEWNPDITLVDPMCGSGTLLIEACWLAIRRPPGLTRKRFGFQGWMDYDIELWTALRDDARRNIEKQLRAPILGYDLRHDSIRFSDDNSRSAGVRHLLKFERRDLSAFAPPEGSPGVLICNPPYGERIGEEQELRVLYRDLGRVFRDRLKGWQVFVFTGNPRLAEEIGMSAVEEIPLYNGKIRCRLLKYQP